MIKPGALIGGKYVLTATIGEGGMGAVWRAEHQALARPVAIKFIRQESNTPEMAARFMREARTSASVRHRNVVDILDFGTTEDGLPYIVMELLEGQNLKERLGSPLWLPTNEFVEIMAGALTGLEAVHRAGIVHRDLKPDNIFLARDPEAGIVPKLVDFGISRSTAAAAVAASTDKVTKTGSLVGTPHYMSAEQARGLRDIDARSDVYSMGVILFEGLTGRLPFDSDTLGGLLIAIATSEYPPVTKIRPDIGPALAQVVHTAIARAREQRYASVREMKQALLIAVGASPAEGTGRYAVPAFTTPGAGPPATLNDRPAPATAIGTNPTLVASSGKGLRAWHLATAAGVLALVGVGAVLTIGGSETSANAPAATTAPASTAPLPEPEVTVRLQGVPADGVIRLDGALASGPDLRIPRDGRLHAIEVAAPGRESWRATHTANGDGEYVVEIAPASPATAAPETARPRTKRTVRRTKTGGQGSGGLIDDPGF